MSRDDRRVGNNPGNKGAWVRNFDPHPHLSPRPSGSPDRSKTVQAHQDMANIPDSEPRMVTLLRVSPRAPSVASQRPSRSRHAKAALEEKRSQYLEYASKVEERKRQSKAAAQGGRPRNHESRSSNNVSQTRNNGHIKERTQSNPQLAHRQLSEVQQTKPRQQPPSKPKRNFSQSPPRPITREPNRLPNGQPHNGPRPMSSHYPETHRTGSRDSRRSSATAQQVSENRTSSRTPSQVPVEKRKPKSLYPLPETSHQLQVPPRVSRSPNRPQNRQPTKGNPEIFTKVRVQADVHHQESSSKEVPSQRNSLPVDPVPTNQSILSWIDKMDAHDMQEAVSNSYPPTVRSQSADPRNRISASKADLHRDLKNFNEMNLPTRKRVTSPDTKYSRSREDAKTRSSTAPEPRERRSRLDEFSRANQVPPQASQTQHQPPKTSQSRIPVKKGSSDRPRDEASKRQVQHPQAASTPQPPPRQRNTSRHDPARAATKSTPNSKSEIPSRSFKEPPLQSEPPPKSEPRHPQPVKRRENEPQAPPRHRKGSREPGERNRLRSPEENKSPPSDKPRKTLATAHTSSAHPERPQRQRSVTTPETNTTNNSQDVTPKRPKSTSPLNQELRRRLSQILVERAKENERSSRQAAPATSSVEVRSPASSDQDVVDRMLNSTVEQDFKGELDKNLAQRKTKLEQSIEKLDRGGRLPDKGQPLGGKQNSAPSGAVDSSIGEIHRDSGLGASYESNYASSEKVLKDEMPRADASRSLPEEVDVIVSEWSDEMEVIQLPAEDPKPTQAIKPESPVFIEDPVPVVTAESPVPSVVEEIPRKVDENKNIAHDEVKWKVKLRRWSIASDGERPRVKPRPLSSNLDDKQESGKVTILSSMKVGIRVPDATETGSIADDRESVLDDSNGLLNVKGFEEEIEKASSSVASTPQPSTPSRGSATPGASPSPITLFQDSEEDSVPPSPRRKTPPQERLIQRAASQHRHSDRSHQSLRQLPVKVLPTSPQGAPDPSPTFSEDHDMSVISLSRPTTPSQPSKSPTDINLKNKSRYLKISGMQLLPQKLQLLSSKDRAKDSPQPVEDEPDGPKQGLYKRSEQRGRERSKRDAVIPPAARVKKRSASADGFFSLHRERSSSPMGLRGFRSPSRQGKVKDKRGRHKMLTPPGNHALKMPRQPRPQRMHTILESLKKGLKDTIEVSKEKLVVMEQHQHDPKTTSSRQGFHYNLDKQIKVAERYIRKLQFHLAKVEEVHEQYDKELKVREGAVNVVKAYADTNLPHSKDPSSEAKANVRDCTQSLCQMEAELEANLGAFVVRIDGIAGFARVCRGDIFEVVFKYGLQKWKSRCKVEKDLSQSWDVDEIVMYPMLADFLTIKVTEMRGIARSNMVIGNLEFDTSDFYQADPQTLTIDVNENGTIKLNLVVTWSPFHINEEMYKSPKNSYSRRERAFTESMANLKAFNSSTKEPLKSPKKFSTHTLDLNTSPTLTLEEAMHNVTRLLEILKGQYSELDILEKQVGHLNDILKRIRERKKRDSTMSLLVKNALDSFDFLNDVDEDEGSIVDSGSCSMDENRSSITSDELCKSQSSDRLSDCASLEEPPPTRRDSAPSPSYPSPQNLPLTRANRGSHIISMSEKRESRLIEMNEQRERRLVDSPSGEPYGRCWEESTESSPKLTTSNNSIDLVLVQHLMYIEYLLSHLGAFGPLKLKETIALQKLKKQAIIIEQLLVLSVSNSSISRADDVFPELKLNPLLLEFWQHCAEKEALFVNAESFLLQLDVKFGAKLRTSHPDIADDVFQSLCNRIIERPVDLYHPKTIITLFQYIGFFATDDRRSPEKFIGDLTKDFELTSSLEASNPDLLKVMKKLPKGSLISTGNLRALALLLLEDRASIQMGVRVYLESICGDEKMRKKAVNVYLECLEERDLSLRQAGCAAIAAMKANEALEQLLYLLKCDMDDVKSTAKEALMAFGDEGRQAYEQISYTPYGNYTHDYSEIDVPLMTTEL